MQRAEKDRSELSQIYSFVFDILYLRTRVICFLVAISQQILAFLVGPQRP